MSSSPLILIDGSNFTFWRYNATRAWWSHSKQGEPEDCHVEHDLFREKYTMHFWDTVAKIEKKFKTKDILWCQDTPRRKLWRMDVDTNYKGTRDDQKCPEIGPIFEYTYGTLLEERGCLSISAENAEADDCVGVICHYIRESQPDREVVIISNDTDFLQLVDDQVKLVKPAKLQPVPLKCDSGEKYLKIKVLTGDTSDNIPKVFKGCGPKKAEELISDSRAFELQIKSHPDRWARYQHNLNLISFKEIPEEIKDDILAKYQVLCQQAKPTKFQLKESKPKTKPKPKIMLKNKKPKIETKKPTLSLSNKS
jgi:5'-3' exonuclease